MSLMQTFRNWLGRSADNNSQSGRRPDGGTSCFRPNRKTDDRNAAGAASAIRTESPQDNVSFVHTGFTGMNPPQTGVYPPVGGMETDGWNGWTQQTRTGFYTGYQPNAAAGAQTVQANAQDGFRTPQNQSRRSGRRRGEDNSGNVFFMPGAFPGQQMQSLPQRVEHILNMNGLRSCYEAIDCMKNGETLIVLMEMIESEGDVVRCQDMLTGAAFTLGCTVRMLRGSRLILIAPPQVRILPEETPSINTQPVNPVSEMAAEGMTEPRSMFETEKTENPRRRRVSQNTRGWRPGEDRQVNPYTGTTPVASGAYGEFGGFR